MVNSKKISEKNKKAPTGGKGIVDDFPIDPTGNDTISPASSPEEIGEQSVSGDMPDPSSDDDTLENEHAVGLHLDEDEEHPQELDIGSDIDKAEEYHRNH